jgi:hypothetical protein
MASVFSSWPGMTRSRKLQEEVGSERPGSVNAQELIG